MQKLSGFNSSFVRYYFVMTVVAGAINVQSCAKSTQNSDQSEVKEFGLVGVSCESKPDVRDSQGFNVCIFPEPNWPGLKSGDFWFSPLTMALARESALRACKDANALDNGVQFGHSCYAACDEVTHCLPFVPNPEV